MAHNNYFSVWTGKAKRLDTLDQNHALWFNLTNLALAQEVRSTPHTDPNKGICLRSCHSLPAPCLPWPPVKTLEMCHVLLPGPLSNKLLYFNVHCVPCSINHSTPSDISGLYLLNVNLTKSPQLLAKSNPSICLLHSCYLSQWQCLCNFPTPPTSETYIYFPHYVHHQKNVFCCLLN